MISRHRLHGFLAHLAIASAAALIAACAPGTPPSSATPLRLSVALTPPELVSFESALREVQAAHSEWEITLETIPQSGMVEKITTQLASGTLPDVIRLPGLSAQQWVRRGAFLPLDDSIQGSGVDLDDFYPGSLEQFTWGEAMYGLPDTGAPDFIYYNMDMFDAAGLDYPDESWTFEDMRTAARLLTLDKAGRNPGDAGFDPQAIEQWGWKGGLTFFWQRELLSIFGGDTCLNSDCTLMTFTSPELLEAVAWWASMVQEDYSAPYDPYSGAQTGIPGDPLLSGRSAMGNSGYFLIGQLRASGNARFGITEPFLNSLGGRRSALSTNGYVISANTQHPEQAWELMLALLEPQFLSSTWGLPGHSIPARRSVATTSLDPALTAEQREVILAVLEYSEVFKPFTANAFEAHAKTTDLFVQAMKGELGVLEAMTVVENTANQVLEADRGP